MARMIPTKPRDFASASLEGVLFDGLSQLSDDYYVFHSFKIVSVIDGIVRESETDFVVFNRSKGILCIEAKAGQVSYSDGTWYYGSGIEMSHGGPFEQARSNMRRLMQLFENKGLTRELKQCKFLHAVWFPSVSRKDLYKVSMPSDANLKVVLLNDDIFNPTESIERLFLLSVPSHTETSLSDQQARLIINRVLCPSFNLFVSSTLDIDLGRHAFRKMIREQTILIDFLEEQPCAAINGAAGTGKTVLAIEKAQRAAILGERVLFLCYNRRLRDYLADNYKNDFIDFYTIDGLAAHLLGLQPFDSSALEDKLTELYVNATFPYKHVVVDEGQDFGQQKYEEAGILELLSEAALSLPGGSFYVFYDNMQLVQGSNLPRCISEADCRVTLRRNCRNTENIAVTSMVPLMKKAKPLMRDGIVKGELPRMVLVNDSQETCQAVEDAYGECVARGFSDAVILTCAPMDKSSLIDRVVDGHILIGKDKVRFTTCRRFKGLEADAVILIDITKESLIGSERLLFYVGASRARFKLYLIGELSDEDCASVLASLGKNVTKRPKKALATALNSMLDS